MSLKARNRNDDGGERLYSHAYRTGAVVQLIPGLASTLSAMRGNPVQVFSATRNKLLSVDEYKSQTAYLSKTNQLGSLIEGQDGKVIFEVTNVPAGVVRRIEIPLEDAKEDKLLKGENNNRYGALSPNQASSAYVNELPDGTVVCLDVTGKGRVLEVDMGNIQESLKEWASMNGQGSDQNERLGIRITDEANAQTSGAFEGEGIEGEGGEGGEGEGEGEREEDSDDSDSVSSDERPPAVSADHAFDALINKIKASHLQLHKDITDFDTETAALSKLFTEVLELLNAIKSPDCKLTCAEFKQQLIVAFTKYDELVTSSTNKDESNGYAFISSYRDDLDQVRKLVGSSTNEDIKNVRNTRASKGDIDQRYRYKSNRGHNLAYTDKRKV